MARKQGKGKVPHIPRTTKLTPILSQPSNKRRGWERAFFRDAIRQYAKSQGLSLAQVRQEARSRQAMP